MTSFKELAIKGVMIKIFEKFFKKNPFNASVEDFKAACSIKDFIILFHEKIFNVTPDVHIIPANFFKNKILTTIASYDKESDSYFVIDSNIKKLPDKNEGTLIAVVSHEVRHKIQQVYPQVMFSPDSLLKKKIITKESLGKIKEIYKDKSNPDVIEREVDSMFIEGIIIKNYGDKKVLSDQDLKDIYEILTLQPEKKNPNNRKSKYHR